MLRKDLLQIFESNKISSEQRKTIATNIGYSGVDGGVQGLRKYLGAVTIEADTKNVCEEIIKVIGYGTFTSICKEQNINSTYNEFILANKNLVDEIEKNLPRMSLADAFVILEKMNKVLKKYTLN